MKYLNAKNGIKKIIISQYFAIIAALATSGSSLFLLILYNQYLEKNTSMKVMFVTLSFGASILLTCMFALTFVLYIIGCFQASKDEPEFKRAAFCAIASGLLLTTGIFFKMPNGMIYTMLNSAGTIVEMFIMVFAVSGLINISRELGRTDMENRGNVLLKILLFTYIITALNEIVSRIFELSSLSRIILVIALSVELALNVARYIIYLSYLRRNLKMLTESNTDDLE